MTTSILVATGGFALAFIFCAVILLKLKKSNAEAVAGRVRAEQAERLIVELQQYVATQEQTTQALRESRERLRRAVYHDALTGLPNRDLFLENLKFLLEKKKSAPEFSFAVLFLDLNRFKSVNESLGHSVGDQLIKSVAERLEKLIGGEDTLARLGGDDFGMILSNCGDENEILNFVQLINDKMILPFSVGDRQIFVKISIGIAFGNIKYELSEEILRDADIAMNSAKNENQKFAIFKRPMHARAVNLHQLETDLRYALDRREFEPYFQPIVSLETLEIVGFETLIRWNHPRKGIISPGEFINLCEDNGLIVPITYWILEESCRRLAEWQKIAPDLTISVNLSGEHFSDKNLLDEIQKIIAASRIAPRTLKLEITESAVMRNAENAIETLKRLKELGTQILIDDFGTGYSSLSYLHRFPVDTLKIDRSFVATMEDGSENGEIVRTVIALAKTLGLNIIAEGIETIHQFHQLRILGCRMGQGFLFSRAVPAEEAARFVVDKRKWRNILPNSQTHPQLPPSKSEIPILEIGEV
jgi:diguanylate cyclase (GGDEF)-like protein